MDYFMTEITHQNELTYKGFVGTYDFDESGPRFTGRVSGIRAVISFQGQTIEELELSFRNSVNLFLNMIQEEAQKTEISAENDRNKRKAGEMLVISIPLTEEIMQKLDAYKKDGTVEEYVVKLITHDIEYRERAKEFRQFFVKWRFPKIVEATPLKDYVLKVKFEDGAESEYDMKPSIQRGGEFAALSDITFFNSVSIGDNGNYISWSDLIEVGVETIYWDLWGDAD
jgi:predicted HicB family RNase H-like nuclease